MAQEWAEECIFEHGNPKRNDLEWDNVGQNLHVNSANQKTVSVN